VRRRAMVPVFLAALATGGALIASSGGAQQQGAPTGTLEVVGLNREHEGDFVDNPPRQGRRRPPSTGDLAVIQQRLRDTSNRRVGEMRAILHKLGGRDDDTEVVATFKLTGGQITVQGPVDERSRRDRSDTLTITGGTGAYEDAGGTLTVTQTRRARSFLFDFAG
jgi:hypothetical protein